MVALLFGQLAHAVDEVERLAEIGKIEDLVDVVFADDVPSGDLAKVRIELRTLQRRHADPARHAGLAGQFSHGLLTPDRTFRWRFMDYDSRVGGPCHSERSEES